MKTVQKEIGGKMLTLESGKLAKLADASVMVRYGDTMVLSVVVANDEPKEGIDFLPLQVEYREKYAAAGKFPGGFFRREAKPSDKETLASRLIDRPVRPMFNELWCNDTQIICTVYSFDQENEGDVLAAIGSSCALMLAGLPFNGPITNVRVGYIDNEFVINPTIPQLVNSTLEIIVSGTDTSIVMVEGECKEISEELFVEALEFGHKYIKEINDLQRELVAMFEVTPITVKESRDVSEISKFVNDSFYDKILTEARTSSSKDERKARRKILGEEVKLAVSEKFPINPDDNFDATSVVDTILHDIESSAMREMVLSENKRLDGRSSTDIRSITSEVTLLPRSHGSALFTRGETQSLTTATLGTRLDKQLIDGLEPKHEKRFLLHYNFPKFSTGETGRLGFTSRREIGHGNLAERGLKFVIPDEKIFPYAIRIVSDILESNGSSSMATGCAGALAMMDAGIPILKPVAGIAMGLIFESEQRVAILSDILGDEDHLGDMDFKVVGTNDGITACQMDIKIQGISLAVMKKALLQAQAGRIHILSKMAETMTEHRDDLSQYAPRLTTMMVPVEMIGAIIGSGGETIRSIVAESGAEVDIQNDGTVVVAAVSGEAAAKAIQMIIAIITPPEEGKTYMGKVTDIKDGMGAIIEFMPKKTGLLHISELDYKRIEKVQDVVNIGDKIEIKLVEIGEGGKFRLSRKALLPKPEGYVEQERRPRPTNDRRDDRRGGGGGDRRGGSGGGYTGGGNSGGYTGGGDRRSGGGGDRKS